MLSKQEVNTRPISREVVKTLPAERIHIVTSFLQRPDIEELPTFEKHIIGQALGQFLQKGMIDSSALHTSAQQNIPRNIDHGSILPILGEDGLRQDIKTTISNLGEKGLLVLNEEHNSYSLGQEPSHQKKDSLH